MSARVGEGAAWRRRPTGRCWRPAVLALNALTLGIPCVYYGSEQGFDGAAGGNGPVHP